MFINVQTRLLRAVSLLLEIFECSPFNTVVFIYSFLMTRKRCLNPGLNLTSIGGTGLRRHLVSSVYVAQAIP